MIDTQDKIPTSKVERAMKLVGAGAKIGGNYLKYYAKKTINGDTTKEELHANNANDIYQSLSQLKGSALKVAQMLSMDKNLLPRAYTDKFAGSLRGVTQRIAHLQDLGVTYLHLLPFLKPVLQKKLD